MRQGQPQNRQRTRGRGNNNRNNNNNNNNSNNHRNQLNRSMESNGPDVRIRGTAAHIAEKYNQLANDAQTAGDSVGAQSYFQFAEHYNRLVAAAQAAIQQSREEQEARRDNRNDNRDSSNDADAKDGNNDSDDDSGEDQDNRGRNRNRNVNRSRADSNSDDGSDGDQDDRRPRRSRTKPEPASSVADGPQPVMDSVPAEVALNTKPVAAKKDDAEEAPKKTRRPRKPKPDPSVATEEAGSLPAFVTGAE